MKLVLPSQIWRADAQKRGVDLESMRSQHLHARAHNHTHLRCRVRGNCDIEVREFVVTEEKFRRNASRDAHYVACCVFFGEMNDSLTSIWSFKHVWMQTLQCKALYYFSINNHYPLMLTKVYWVYKFILVTNMIMNVNILISHFSVMMMHITHSICPHRHQRTILVYIQIVMNV